MITRNILSKLYITCNFEIRPRNKQWHITIFDMMAFASLCVLIQEMDPGNSIYFLGFHSSEIQGWQRREKYKNKFH